LLLHKLKNKILTTSKNCDSDMKILTILTWCPSFAL